MNKLTDLGGKSSARPLEPTLRLTGARQMSFPPETLEYPGVPWSTLENPLKYPKVGVQPRGPQKPPLGCPYRPLISYKIGQMPTVTRGG